MELLDIIVNSLKIFCFTVITVITVSYLVYKVKSRKKSKTYFGSLKKQTDPVKIIYKKADIDQDHFQIVKSLTDIPPGNIIGKRQRAAKYLPSTPGLIAVRVNNHFPEIRKIKFNILDYYSVDKSDVMYKIKN